MHFSLTPELEELVNTKVQTGRYNSASEVVCEALRLLKERDRTHEARLAEFNAGIGRRLAGLDRGESIGAAKALAKLRRKSKQRRNRRG